MSEGKQIYKAIPAIIAEVGPVGKNSKNEQQGYKYRSADDISDALHDALGKHGVFATCKIENIERGERSARNGGNLQVVTLKATYTFHAADGSSVSTEAVGDGMDSGDKAANKAMTAAYKYALIQVFAMMGHEDSERDSPEPAPKPVAKGTATAKAEARKEPDPELTEAEKAYVGDCSVQITAEVARADKEVAEANLEVIRAFIKDKPMHVQARVVPLWKSSMKMVNPNWKPKEVTA